MLIHDAIPNLLERMTVHGSFRLKSGATSDTYLDKFIVFADPQLMACVAEEMMLLVPTSTDVLAGLQMGSVPLTTALSLYTNKPFCLLRKHRKLYGTGRLIEGADTAGKNVCIIEDIVTTGDSIATAAVTLREVGATVTDAICLATRGGYAETILLDMGIRLTGLIEA